MPKEVDALRASLDARLAALEKAIADPKQHESLEALILDLARTATQEADATARNAVLDAQKAGQTAAAAARTEAMEALQAEKVESAALRQVIEQAKAALKQAEAALKDERRQRKRRVERWPAHTASWPRCAKRWSSSRRRAPRIAPSSTRHALAWKSERARDVIR